MKNMHPILQQQLNSFFETPGNALPEHRNFLEAVDQTYFYLNAEIERLKRTLKLSAAELNEANAEIEVILKALPDIVLRINHENTILYVNGGHQKHFGVHPEELLQISTRDFPLPQVAQKFREYLPRVRKSQKQLTFEYTLEHNGTRYFEARLLPFFADDVIVVIRDITERKSIELRLQRAHAETEHLLAAISSILIGVGPDDYITRWNAVAEKTFGVKADEAVGKPFIQCGIEWNWIEVLERVALSREKDQPTQFCDIPFTRPDGREGFLNITINPVLDDNSRHRGYLLLGSETTEKKFLEAQLAQAQKLESIGQLASGIAHEINTPAQYVGDNTHFLSTAFQKLSQTFDKYEALLNAAKNGGIPSELITEVEKSKDQNKTSYLLEEIPSAIDETLEGVSRISKIVKAMKEYAHPGAEEKTLADINAALENTITVSRNEWKYDADLETDLNPNLPQVPCLPGELNQVFLNIIVNAAHAIHDANKQLQREKGLIRISTDFNDREVIIRIADNGLGIPEQHQQKVFDPFFTTKEVGRGSGQGLAISHNVIVTKHQGRISFDTHAGKGTTFTIRLPIQQSGGQEVKHD